MTRDEAVQQDTAATRQIRRLNTILLAVFFVILAVPAVGTWWVSRQLPVVSTVSIDNMALLSPAALCPGEPLIVAYDFHATGEGILVRDWTAWYVEPPKTMIFSMSRRFILDGPTDQHLTETWRIPDTYLNYETEQMETLPPGHYRRYLAISSPSRSSVIAIEKVEFEVRADCS